VPSDKRARKRAAREVKMAALQRQRRRRAAVRRTITIVVIVGVVIGIYFAVSGGSKPKAKLTATQIAQQTANTAAVAAGCPSSPTKALTKPKWSKPPAMTIDTAKTYTATVKTDVGTIVIALDAAQTPITVNNFVFLADKDFYNCVIFQRVIPTFMDQTGDPTGTGSGGPGYQFADELPKKASPQYPIGSVAMANAGPNTNGSQFFIVTGSEGESLPASYTLFGHVTSGLSVADKINADGNSSASANGVPPKVIHRMLKVTISSS
jgi:cyclophilin family peptidyl-prolyl cis-trans isomerase